MARFALISQFTGETMGFVLLGLWIDWRWNLLPWCTIFLGMAGLGVALFHLIRNVNPPQDRL